MPTSNVQLMSLIFRIILTALFLSFLPDSPCSAPWLEWHLYQMLHADGSMVENSLSLAFLMDPSRVSSMLEFWTGFSELDKSCIWTFSGCNNEERDIFIANLACYMHISSPAALLKTSVHLCHHLKVADDICREWFLFWGGFCWQRTLHCYIKGHR